MLSSFLNTPRNRKQWKQSPTWCIWVSCFAWPTKTDKILHLLSSQGEEPVTVTCNLFKFDLFPGDYRKLVTKEKIHFPTGLNFLSLFISSGFSYTTCTHAAFDWFSCVEPSFFGPMCCSFYSKAELKMNSCLTSLSFESFLRLHEKQNWWKAEYKRLPDIRRVDGCWRDETGESREREEKWILPSALSPTALSLSLLPSPSLPPPPPMSLSVLPVLVAGGGGHHLQMEPPMDHSPWWSAYEAFYDSAVAIVTVLSLFVHNKLHQLKGSWRATRRQIKSTHTAGWAARWKEGDKSKGCSLGLVLTARGQPV